MRVTLRYVNYAVNGLRSCEARTVTTDNLRRGKVANRHKMAERKVPKMPRTRSDDDLQPSVLVSRFASQIVSAAGGRPILDVACGSGRNALALSRLDATVICVDRDLTRLRSYEALTSSEKLKPCQLDLEKESWPFGEATAGGIINVHFLLPSLFSFFKTSLFADGFLLI